ncbi:MAG: pilus assembly protein [Sediminimonas qiaohouensis]|uniref:Pilus assembly protein n=2 Tax=Sediminimonas qiaohouensis TaxID=552061 RepID=A0A7C9HLQ1_9RHOB|nr:pilus assembly protein [Sediminimonas qiaohouensis]
MRLCQKAKPSCDAHSVRDRVLGHMHRFARQEDGVMVILSLYMFLIMILVGGIGVDLMRFEMERTRLQNTLDRAVLAAADLDQTLDPKDVVMNYFDKSGLGNHLTRDDVTVTQGVGFRKVQATARSTFDTHFMHLTGVETLTAPGAGAAEESIGSVEVSLVLDISGSMNSNSRLSRLKPAARGFVDTILDNSEEGNVSVSVVPYATQVNAGEALLDQYTTTHEHDYSHCVNFIADEYSKPNLARDVAMQRTGHFDVFTYSEDPISTPVCPTRAESEILPLSGDRTTLHNHINSLTAKGNTSIDIGMKWGTTLLDPGTRSVVSDLVAAGEISSDFEGRPSDYRDGETLKIVVLMSDGQNTNQYMLNPSLRDGDSEVWYNEETGRYSVYKSERETNYYWPHSNDWHDHPYGNGTYTQCQWEYVNWQWQYLCSEQDEPGSAVRLTYPELWAQVSLAWNAYYNYEFSSSAWADWYNSAHTYLNGTAKDQRTDHICDAAKDEGIIVFTIGFEAPHSGRRVLKRCASSASHYFDVEGLEIEEAFASIAASIRKLRLTQ